MLIGDGVLKRYAAELWRSMPEKERESLKVRKATYTARLVPTKRKIEEALAGMGLEADRIRSESIQALRRVVLLTYRHTYLSESDLTQDS